MKKIIILFIFGLLTLSLQAQQYISHTVKKGETVFSIAKKYHISVEEIYALNPDAKNGIGVTTILVIPTKDNIIASEKVKFKKHKVRRRETLFSIAQKYNISIDDIKKYNKHLYSKSLKKGEKLRIPVGIAKTTSQTTTEGASTTSSSSKNYHTVIAKETKYGIARKYGISIAELETQNPQIKDGLKIGMKLVVPENSVTDSATIENDNFKFYEVQPKEGFFRLKVKLGLTKAEIIALNPYAKNGLKEGMILKIPKRNNEEINDDNLIESVNLENRLSNFSTKNVVVMLPFQLEKLTDSTEANKQVIKRSKRLRVAIDFYSGVLMALDFAKELGISSNVTVYDTKASEKTVGKIISENNFENTDVVIGPLLQKNVSKAAYLLEEKNIPVFSPLSNRKTKLYANFFQTIPSQELLENKMLQFLKNNSEEKNIIIIADSKRGAQKQKLLEILPESKVVDLRTSKKGEFLYATDIENIIDETKPNWVILETTNPVILSNVIGLLNGIPKTKKIRLFTLEKNKEYDYHDISNMHLGNLNFTFPSVQKPYDHKDVNSFIASYKNKYGVLPNRYAVRGFDVMYDVLLRLSVANNIYDAYKYPTQYIENKFKYTKKMFTGYQNEACYILKYNPDLSIEVIQ